MERIIPFPVCRKTQNEDDIVVTCLLPYKSTKVIASLQDAPEEWSSAKGKSKKWSLDCYQLPAGHVCELQPGPAEQGPHPNPYLHEQKLKCLGQKFITLSHLV